MTSEVRYSIRDYSGKVGKTTIRFANVTDANFVGVNGLMDDVRDAIVDVVAGQLAKEDRVMAANLISTANATDENAHRGRKWLVTYTDINNPLGSGSFEIPCPEDGLLNANSIEMNIGSGAGLALVTALNAGMVSRLGNPVTVNKIVVVSRSS